MPAYAPRQGRKASPQTLALVIGLHGAAIAALLLAKPMLVEVIKDEPILVDPIPIDEPPPPVPLPPQPQSPAPESIIRTPDPIVPTPAPTTPIEAEPVIDFGPIVPYVGESIVIAPDPGPPLIEIRQTEARLLTPPDRLRPPYPESKRRMDEEATLRLRLTIGADGRVLAVAPVGQADPDFLRAAERHIKRVWRYSPALEGDRKVESEKVISLRFELTG